MPEALAVTASTRSLPFCPGSPVVAAATVSVVGGSPVELMIELVEDEVTTVVVEVGVAELPSACSTNPPNSVGT